MTRTSVLLVLFFCCIVASLSINPCLKKEIIENLVKCDLKDLTVPLLDKKAELLHGYLASLANLKGDLKDLLNEILGKECMKGLINIKPPC